jgi:hypothetical protein
MSASRPGAISRSSGHSSTAVPGPATSRAVSTVRGRPLATMRSKRAAASAAPAVSAWRRPLAVSGTSSGGSGWPSSSK